MEFSHRLKAIESLVPSGARLLDVGSDHAALPIALIKSNKIQKAIASDINSGPLENGRSSAFKQGLENKIEFILSNGFENIEKGTFDCAAICGMGGHLIAEIIQGGKEKILSSTLILQPMTAPDALRKYLFENGFSINEEVFVVEGNKRYVIIKAVYSGINSEYTYSDLLFGKIRPKTKEFEAYCAKIKISLLKRLKGTLKSHKKQKEYSEQKLPSAQ